MTAPVTASERDLRTLAGIVSDHRADLPAEGLPPSLLADLMGQIRCDEVTFVGMDSGRQADWFGQDIPAHRCYPRTRTWSGRTGSSTGTANPAATPTAPATCAAS